MYVYSLGQWLLFFFLYCFLGWVWESCYVSAKRRQWVNRGFLHGPMLPIYGTGAVIILLATIPVRDSLWLVFLLGMLAATALEYVTGAAMEALFKVRYWDYSKQRFQFQGYICLRSSLCWGFLGLILTSVIHPPIEKLVLGLPFIGLIVIDVLFSAAFISDVIVSVRSALDLAKVLEELDRLREQGYVPKPAVTKKVRLVVAADPDSLSGKAREIHWLLWVVAAGFLLPKTRHQQGERA